jgi:hypothetical protein
MVRICLARAFGKTEDEDEFEDDYDFGAYDGSP